MRYYWYLKTLRNCRLLWMTISYLVVHFSRSPGFGFGATVIHKPLLFHGVVSTTFHFVLFVQSTFLGVACWREPIHPTFPQLGNLTMGFSLHRHELLFCLGSYGFNLNLALCIYHFSSSWDTLFKASVASTDLVAANSLWECATWSWNSPITLLASVELDPQYEGFLP